MSKTRISKHYNIAKKARDWANQTYLLGELPNWCRIRTRRSIGKAVERMMREVYQEGIEEGWRRKEFANKCDAIIAEEEGNS